MGDVCTHARSPAPLQSPPTTEGVDAPRSFVDNPGPGAFERCDRRRCDGTVQTGLQTECRHIEADLILLLDGGLDVLRVEEVNRHFAGCRRCTAFYEGLRSALVDDAPAEFDAAFGGLSFPRTDFDALSSRIETADLKALGRLLYEVLKAEFLFDYGDNVAVDEEPIADPIAERLRGVALVEDLRDWVDGNVVDGVDLREVARELAPPPVDHDRLDRLIAGMRAVGRYDPALSPKASHYIALAHIKARRAEPALHELAGLVSGPDPVLAGIASILRATIPGMLQGRPAESVAALGQCFRGDGFDGVVHFNLAQAHFEAAGERVTPEVRSHIDAARAMMPDAVDRQLATRSMRKLRLALKG